MNIFVGVILFLVISAKTLPIEDNETITTDPDTHELTVECQHGQEECRDNAIHACIIETIEIGKAIDCAREFNLDIRPVETCLKNRTNAEILKKYGEETEKVSPQFVPFVVFDDKFDSAKMDNVPYFDREFCKAYKAKYGKELDACSLNFNVSPQKDLNSIIEQLDYFQSAQLDDFKLTKCSKDPKA